MRTFTLGLVLLAANSVAAHAEDRKCIEGFRGWLNDDKPLGMTAIKRLCDPKNFVTDPNEYGWVHHPDDCKKLVRVKGKGAKQQRDALCGTE